MGGAMNTSKANVQTKTKDLILTSLAIGLVYVSTAIIGVEIPTLNKGGLIHLGTGMLYILAILLGARKGAIAGAVGMGMFDFFSPYIIWTPTTVITRAIMGLIVGYIACKDGKQGASFARNIIAMVLGGAWMIVGYYIGEALTFKNWYIPIQSISGNLAQIIVGLPAALILVEAIKKTKIMDQILK